MYDLCVSVFFFFNDTATTEIYTLSLHDALPICFSMDESQNDDRGQRVREEQDPQGHVVAKGRQDPFGRRGLGDPAPLRSEEHTSELQSRPHLVCRLLLEKKKEQHSTSHAPDADR